MFVFREFPKAYSCSVGRSTPRTERPSWTGIYITSRRLLAGPESLDRTLKLSRYGRFLNPCAHPDGVWAG